MKKTSLPLIFFAVTIVATLSAPLIEAAAQISIPGGNIPINEYISKLYTFSLAIGGILAVLMIVSGGILFSVSGAVDKQSEGKSMILSAIFGLVLLLGSYLLLNTINPELTVLRNPGAGFITSGGGDVSKMNSCTATSTGVAGPSDTCQPGESPFNLSTGECQCYNKPKEECRPELFMAPLCPRRVVIPVGGFVDNTGGLYPISSNQFYNESEGLSPDEVVWQYPYYIPSDTPLSQFPPGTTYSMIQPYLGVNNARCLIYAERECGDALINIGGILVPKGGPLTGCQKPVTNRIDLQSWVKPC